MANFYGFERIATMCSRFIIHLFQCPLEHPTDKRTRATLPYFIARVLHRVNFHSSVVVAAMILLCRLKAQYPAVQGSSGHRLFLTALVIADKILNDDSYENESWVTLSIRMFPLAEINQMEQEMCSFLEWDLRVDGEMLRSFEAALNEKFGIDRPYR
ncbi:hypothetical protein DFP72DRAFT_994123 [Ephemerocybe angulata]|uniref:Cyclin N-terminal domain-containing protein n=1 Tax=Ephemerocybe angulata TaxID=980116 RepID=A0A8H6HB58_9AGAR|nr:hypothetical protein DFP72DRAFT_994123 [Tulosesus angulatus]